MDVAAVMAAIATAVTAGTGVRTAGYPVSTTTAPSAFVDYPTDIQYDQTYGRGSDAMTVPLAMLIGRRDDERTTAAVSAYAAGGGASSVKAAVESYETAAWDVAVVTSANFDYVTVGAVPYVAAVFEIEITGQGA
jgi:hypothetical protein